MFPIQLSITLALIGVGVILAAVTLRRRRARDRQRLRQTFVDRQPWLRVYADADRALARPPSEPNTSPPRSTARTRQAHGRPLALGGVTVAAAVATALLVVRPALAPTSDAPAAGDSGVAETTTQLSEPVLTREPVRRQPVDPRAEHDPANPTTTGRAPGTTRASRPTPPTTDPTVSTTTPTPTPDDETTTTTTTTTTEPPPDTDAGDEPDTESEQLRPGARPDAPPDENTHPGRDRPDERPGSGPRSVVFSLVGAVVELVDPRR